VSRVGIIVPGAVAAEQAARALKQLGLEGEIVQAGPENSLVALKSLVALGVSAVLCRPSVAPLIAEKAPVPVLAYEPSELEVARAIARARLRGRPALIHFGSPESAGAYMDLFEELIVVTAARSRTGVHEALSEARTQGAQVIVSGPHLEGPAKNAGFLFESIQTGEVSFLKALKTASEVARAFEMQKARVNKADQILKTLLHPGNVLAFPGLVANSPAMAQAVTALSRHAGHSEPVVLTGEHGSGRSYLACTLLGKGKTSITRLRCDVGDAQVLADALDAVTGGLVVLENADEIPVVACEKAFSAILDGRTRVCLTVSQMVKQRGSHIQQEFWRRVARHVVHVPPLRERRSDIIPLLREFVGEGLGRIVNVEELLSASVRERLINYPWPGNVDELRRVSARLIDWLFCSEAVEKHELDRFVLSLLDETVPVASVTVEGGTLEDMQQQLLHEALQRAGGNKSKAARALGISRTTLWKKLKERGGVAAESERT